MKKNSRFIKSVIATAKSELPALPWQRGGHRAALIASRGISLAKPKAA
ncbi:MAG: hypothetical protein Q9M48_09365 [Rhodobacterales bacterium]|nr:hypothetical protein [Rhodobacterales bacterium]